MMDLVTDFTESNKGNKHIFTIIDLLVGWPEAIPIPNKSADTITTAFIRHYLPRHLCPRFILSDNGMEFKNQTFDRVAKDLGIKRIFSAPYHPQSNGKLETFHKFLKPTLKKMCVEDQDNWDDYVEQVLGLQENHYSFWSMEEMETNLSINYSNHSLDSLATQIWDCYALTNIDCHCP